MPRRDGMDTNEEMRADFNAAAHEVFHVALDRTLESGLSNTLRDKPVNHLYLEIAGKPSTRLGGLKRAELMSRDTPDTSTTDSVGSQRLVTRPITESDVDMMHDHLTMKHYPEDTLDYYAQIARRLADIRLEDGVSLRSEVPANGISADWNGVVEGRGRHVSTFKEKPTKLSLALGKEFTNDALEYVQSDLFDNPFAFDSLVRNIRDGKDIMWHKLSVEFSPYLELNGHESMAWLTKYAAFLGQTEEIYRARLDRLKRLAAAPEQIIDYEQQRYDAYLSALQRTYAVIESRND